MRSLTSKALDLRRNQIKTSPPHLHFLDAMRGWPRTPRVSPLEVEEGGFI